MKIVRKDSFMQKNSHVQAKANLISDLGRDAILALEQEKVLLQTGMDESRRRIMQLKLRYEADVNELEKLNKESLSTTFRRLTGRYKGRMNREVVELLAAKLEYERERGHMRELAAEISELDSRIAAIQKKQAVLEEDIRREAEAQTKDNTDACEGDDACFSLQKVKEETTSSMARLIQNEMALRLARKAFGSSAASLEELEKAEQWTSSKPWGPPGLVSRTMKLSKIDYAQATFSRLSTQMKDLDGVLTDIQLPENALVASISSASHMVEYWFDNILSGENAESLLKASQENMKGLIGQIGGLISVLEANEKEISAHISRLEDQKAVMLAARVPGSE